MGEDELLDSQLKEKELELLQKSKAEENGFKIYTGGVFSIERALGSTQGKYANDDKKGNKATDGVAVDDRPMQFNTMNDPTDRGYRQSLSKTNKSNSGNSLGIPNFLATNKSADPNSVMNNHLLDSPEAKKESHVKPLHLINVENNRYNNSSGMSSGNKNLSPNDQIFTNLGEMISHNRDTHSMTPGLDRARPSFHNFASVGKNLRMNEFFKVIFCFEILRIRNLINQCWTNGTQQGWKTIKNL